MNSYIASQIIKLANVLLILFHVQIYYINLLQTQMKGQIEG